MSKYILFLIVIFVSNECNGQMSKEKSIATSIPTMEQLLQTERVAIDSMERIAVALKQKLELINFAVKALRFENNKGKHDPEKFLSNPINAYSVIRRTHEDWMNWIMYLEEPVGKDEIENLKAIRLDMPTKTDMEEANVAIHRLEVYYDLKPKDVVMGIINGVQYNTSLDAFDAYAIGYSHFIQNSFPKAWEWLQAASDVYKPFVFDDVLHFSSARIHILLAETLAKNGKMQMAFNFLEQVLENDPHNMQLLKERNRIEYLVKTVGDLEVQVEQEPIFSHYIGCRGQFPIGNSNLYCLYNTNASAFVKLAPIKMEIVSLDPYMVLFHDVIYESEIANIKEMSQPILRRATVFDATKQRGEVLNTRTSQFAWFADDFNDVTIKLNQRLTDMTGFSMIGAEQLQGMNYGLGGHYDTHYDFFEANSNLLSKGGNRKATVLFYMSDVEQGGATVFPTIEKAIYPKRGAAIMWYNMNNRGETDERTLHAACPVLVGSKWVTNKWIRENSQMFVDPCSK